MNWCSEYRDFFIFVLGNGTVYAGELQMLMFLIQGMVTVSFNYNSEIYGLYRGYLLQMASARLALLFNNS